MGYNEWFLVSLKTNWDIHILCKDDFKQATKRKPGHRTAESKRLAYYTGSFLVSAGGIKTH